MEIILMFYGFLLLISTIIIFKVKRLIDIFLLYSVLNLIPIFYIDDFKELYGFGVLSCSVVFFFLIKFLKDKYNLESIYGLEGLVYKTPLFAFLFRINLLFIGAFPPFLTADILYYQLLKTKSILEVFITLILLLFDFVIFLRLTNSIIFGKPDKNIVYYDLSIKNSFHLIVLIIINIFLSIYFLLNL